MPYADPTSEAAKASLKRRSARYQQRNAEKIAASQKERRAKQPPCSVEGCPNLQNCKRLCSKHYERLRVKGDIGPAGVISGPLHANWAGDDIGYSRAHSRVKDARGRASSHACVDADLDGCSGRMEWSYDQDCPNEMTGPVQTAAGVFVMSWSPDPMAYSPRCVSHHRQLDHNRSKEMVSA